MNKPEVKSQPEKRIEPGLGPRRQTFMCKRKRPTTKHIDYPQPQPEQSRANGRTDEEPTEQ